MININIGGMSTHETLALINQNAGDKISAKVTSDMAGVQNVKKGKADFYFGACATGGGGALSMAIAILGYSNCFTASMPGKPPKKDEIEKAVKEGKKAFGFTCDHIHLAVPILVDAILAHTSTD